MTSPKQFMQPLIWIAAVRGCPNKFFAVLFDVTVVFKVSRPMHIWILRLSACVPELTARTSDWCCGTRPDRRSLMPSPRPITEVRTLGCFSSGVGLCFAVRWEALTCDWSCRGSGLCAGVLHHRQRLVWGHQQLEGEGGDGGGRHSHRPGAEQNRSAGWHGYQEVRIRVQ